MKRILCLFVVFTLVLITFTLTTFAQNEIATVENSQKEDLSVKNNDVDTDKDGLSDFQEKYKYFTDPKNPDSDCDGITDGDWDERKEYAYTITAVLRVTHPYDINSMNNDHQDARIIDEKEDHIECEIVLYPQNRVKEGIRGNNVWGNYGDKFDQYLKPYLYTNWDERMKEDLVNELEGMGIIPSELSDKELVERVSAWIKQEIPNVQHRMPAEFYIKYYENGNLYVDNKYRSIFEEKAKSDKSMTDEEIFNSLVLGKQMYYNHTRGGCTSSAIHAATIFRALGIPTKHVLTTKIRLYDDKTLKMIEKLENPAIKAIFKENNRSSGNHFFNYVYIGDRWIRLDYDELGSDNIHSNRGVYFEHYTFNDLSELNMVDIFGAMTSIDNWGPFKNEQLYKIIDLHDTYGEYYVEEHPYGINPETIHTYMIFGPREFGAHVRNNVISNIMKVLNRGPAGSINYLKEEYLDQKNLIIISTNDIVYRDIPQRIKEKINIKEYYGLKKDEYKTLKINEATILLIKLLDQSVVYDLDVDKIDKYFIYGTREFASYVRKNIIRNIDKYKAFRVEPGVSGTINLFRQEFFNGKHIVVFSADNEYKMLPQRVKDGITFEEYNSFKKGDCKIFNVNEATVLILKQ